MVFYPVENYCKSFGGENFILKHRKFPTKAFDNSKKMTQNFSFY